MGFAHSPGRLLFTTLYNEQGVATGAQLFSRVGDIYSIDFLGAQGVGMRAVLMDLAGTYRHTPYPRVQTRQKTRSDEFRG